MWLPDQCISVLSTTPLMLMAMLVYPQQPFLEKSLLDKILSFVTDELDCDALPAATLGEAETMGEPEKLLLALVVFQELLSFHQSVGNIDEIARTWFRLGDIYQQLDQFHNSVSSYQQAIEHYQFVDDGLGEVKALSHLGKAYENQGWLSCALEHYEQALVKLRQHEGCLDNATTLSQLALCIEEMF